MPQSPSHPPAHLIVQVFRAGTLLGEYRAQHLHFTDQQFVDWLELTHGAEGTTAARVDSPDTPGTSDSLLGASAPAPSPVTRRYMSENGEVTPSVLRPDLPCFAKYSAGYCARIGPERDDL